MTDEIKHIETALRNFALQTNFDGMTIESIQWFRKYVTKNFSRFNSKKALQLGTHTIRPKIGHMYVYNYDPKHKLTLPYYDTYPLILCFDITKDGWMGINLHYCPPKIRAIIFHDLLSTLNKVGFDEKTKMKLSWAKLKRLSQNKWVKHACKRYLTSHLTSPMCTVHPRFWELAIFLPIAQFEKKTIKEVWADV